jgi:hypothetical protein
MAKVSSTKSSRAQAAELKSNSSSETNETSSSRRAQAITQDALEMEVFEDAPEDLDTPVAGEEN